MFDAIATFFAVLWSMLTLDVVAADQLPAAPPVGVAVAVLVVATVSIGAGHSVVLFLNNLPARRWWAAFGVTLLVVITLRVAQALVLWGLATLVSGTLLRPSVIIVSMFLALAPQVFAFLTALPHVGLLLGRVLSAWELLVMIVLTTAIYDVRPWAALLVVTGVWCVIQAASRLLAEPARRVGTRLWTLTSGQPGFISARDILNGTPLIPVPSAGTESLTPAEPGAS